MWKKASCAACICLKGQPSLPNAARAVDGQAALDFCVNMREAAKILEADFGVRSDIWSVTASTELRRDGWM